MYILECADGSYYTGSTRNLERRLWEHQNFLGANYTRKRLPVKLVYYEEYNRIDEAFYREKQVQGWSRKKKQALIRGRSQDLPGLSRNYTQFGKPAVASTGSATGTGSANRSKVSSTSPSTGSGHSSGQGSETGSKKGVEPVETPDTEKR